MSPMTVFVRVLLKSSAICLGVALAIVQPSFDGRPSPRAVAQQSPVQAAIDGLVNALTDPDPGVRRSAAIALGDLRAARAVPALIAATRDGNAEVRSRASEAIRQIQDANPAIAVTDALRGMHGHIGRTFGIEIQSVVGSRQSSVSVGSPSRQSAIRSQRSSVSVAGVGPRTEFRGRPAED